jgi:hypothetical protein
VNNSNGCNGAWCEFFVTEDASGTHLFVVKNADGDTDTADGTPLEITTSTRINTMAAIGSGHVLENKKLRDLEKLPFVVDDRLAQYSTEDGTQGVGFEQQLIQQIMVVSGPNFHSEEGADPYAWVICGSRGHEYGEEVCNMAGGGAIDANGHMFAIVYVPGGGYTLGENPLTRFGRDMNPRRVGNTLYPQNLTDSLNPDTMQDVSAYVECHATQTTIHPTSTCVSNPGPDAMYGTADDGTIYYREAIENGLRGWIRETNGHAFSFLGADTDGTHDGISPANFGLTQLLQQREETQGILMSCLGCNPHTPPQFNQTVTYEFNWPGLPAINPVLHDGEGNVIFADPIPVLP